MEKNKVKWIDILRVVLCALAVCAMLAAILNWYCNDVPQVIEKLQEEGRMTNTIWLVRYGSVLPPVIAVAVIITLFYCKKSSCVPVRTQKEKAYISLIAAIFTFGVMLPYVIHSSQGWDLPVPEGEEDIVSLLEKTVIWFCAQVIPFLVLISYHFARAESEKRELLKNERSENENK